MKNLSLAILVGLTTFFVSSTVIHAETVNAVNTETINDQAVENEGTLDQYFNRAENDNNQNASEQPLSAQATTEGTTPPADGSATTAPAGTTTDPAAAPVKKTVKRRKKKAPVAATTDGVVVEGATGHGAQETGLPYKANIDLDFKYQSQSLTQKFEDLSTKKTTTTLGLDVAWLFIFSKMEAGPVLAYGSTTTKEGEEDAVKTSTMGIGGAFVMNFGNIHADKMVPYAGVSLLMNTETGDSKVSTKTTNLGLQGGVKYFLGGHLALKPFLSYEMTVSGEYKDESGESASVASLSGNNLELGVGLAKYF